MAVRRPRRARAPRVPAVPGTRMATLGSVGGGELAQAAEEIAAGARELGSWSSQIVASVVVEAGEKTALVFCDAGPAYPGETRARHPLFGDRRHWYGPPGHPFLGPAADARAGAAMARYAGKVDRLCREAGFS